MKSKAKTQDNKMVVVKTGEEDRRLIAEKAARYAGGNVSAWFRHAARNYAPAKGEKVELLPSYSKKPRRTA